MSDVKDINEHIVREIENEDLRVVEFDPDWNPGSEPVLSLRLDIHESPEGDGTWLYGIGHDNVEGTPERTNIPVEVVLEGSLAQYMVTAKQLLADFPEPVRRSYEESLLESLHQAHQGFIGAVKHFHTISGEVAEMLKLLDDGASPEDILPGLANLANSPVAEDPHDAKE